MDWKKEAVEKLRLYEAKKTSLGRCREELQRLGDESVRVRSASADAVPVKGGASTREDKLISNIVKRQELRLAVKIAASWVRTVEGGLNVLSAEERLILDRFYIRPAKGNVDRLCQELGLEKSRVYELKDKALHHFTIALYGVTET